MVLFHRFLTASVSLYTSSVSLFPPFSLPFRFPSIYPSFLCVDIFFLFLVYNTFTTMSFFLPLFIPFFYPFLFPSRIFPLPYFSSTRLLSLTPIHLLTFSRVLRPTCANAIYTYSLRILSRTLTHSLRFFHVATVFVRLAGLVGFSLRSTTFPPPLSTPYCHLVIVPRIYESSRVERC